MLDKKLDMKQMKTKWEAHYIVYRGSNVCERT